MASNKINILVIDDLHPCFFEQEGLQKFEITYMPNINPSEISKAFGVSKSTCDQLAVKVFPLGLMAEGATGEPLFS